jgi:hypothetical protein
VVQQRPGPAGRRGAGEVERAAEARLIRREADHGLDDVRVGAIGRVVGRHRERAEIAAQPLDRCERAADHGRWQRRQVALDVDDQLEAAVRVDLVERGTDPVGPRRQRRIGQDRPAARRLDRVADRRLGASHDDRSQPTGHRALPNPHDHRQAGDVEQRLAGQAGRRHSRRDQDGDLRPPMRLAAHGITVTCRRS